MARRQHGDGVRRLARDRRLRGDIQQLVALGALMPIVASIGGNTGNQTVALVVRGLALDQLRPAAQATSSERS